LLKAIKCGFQRFSRASRMIQGMVKRCAVSGLNEFEITCHAAIVRLCQWMSHHKPGASAVIYGGMDSGKSQFFKDYKSNLASNSEGAFIW